ncbi:YhcH/YjgK/YiaL family protein [Niabella ginsengisoli]|uniref:YhcH/YjgK/YiaL family protein n=1 Tax=Niabella ginsengisoli TaxID=522298 RepID=A0ABS9SQT5_9BACT|nr:YhcH/YjgK/YiaL family protein [Niabella ginsengisoli]MCH5600727.1 YhcH/YjgK/YiaL family protein [Niabella ginsengisoli]
MIIDTLQNAAKYYSVHPLFAKAFEYIAGIDLAAIEPGTYEIQDGLKAIVSDKPGRAREESLQKFECHRQNIDIQVCINGNEEIGWKPLERCVADKGGYDEAKDVQFFGDHPDTYFTLTQDQFVILFPEDVHAPMIGEGSIKKMVIKVRV